MENSGKGSGDTNSNLDSTACQILGWNMIFCKPREFQFRMYFIKSFEIITDSFVVVRGIASCNRHKYIINKYA